MEESGREYNTVIGPHASGGGCTQYNIYLLDTKNERVIIYLCVTIVAIVAIIYW